MIHYFRSQNNVNFGCFSLCDVSNVSNFPINLLKLIFSYRYCFSASAYEYNGPPFLYASLNRTKSNDAMFCNEPLLLSLRTLLQYAWVRYTWGPFFLLALILSLAARSLAWLSRSAVGSTPYPLSSRLNCTSAYKSVYCIVYNTTQSSIQATASVLTSRWRQRQ